MRDAMSRLNTIGIDTSLVLLFLAVEVGRSAGLEPVDGLLMALAMLMVLILPYFLASGVTGDASFTQWLGFRTAVMVFGLVVGFVLPGSMRFVPMTLLILAGIPSCCIQFYGLMRLRLAN